MTQTDPLAIRHGAFVAQVWEQIGHARKIAHQPISANSAALHLRHVRSLKRQVLRAHAQEMQRHEFSTPAIDGWFSPLEETLAKAEGFFEGKVASKKLATSIVS